MMLIVVSNVLQDINEAPVTVYPILASIDFVQEKHFTVIPQCAIMGTFCATIPLIQCSGMILLRNLQNG